MRDKGPVLKPKCVGPAGLEPKYYSVLFYSVPFNKPNDCLIFILQLL
jgi:hypothetical protein